MEDEGFICPYPWKWSEIHARLHSTWLVRCAELKAAAPAPVEAPADTESAPASGGDFDLDFGEEDEAGERAWDAPAVHIDAELPPIPEPPPLLPPTSTDPMRQARWRETVAWADEFGFSPLIGTISESDKYYAG